MRKFLIFLLLILAFGCSKKYVKSHTDDGKTSESVEEAISHEELQARAGEGEVSESEGSLFEFQDALFDYDKYNIRPDAREALNSVADWLNDHKDINVLIEGHCDERGTNEYNLALGEKRAKSARDYLISRGVSNSKMSIITYGEEKPMCSMQSANCWQKNRRAHFVVTR